MRAIVVVGIVSALLATSAEAKTRKYRHVAREKVAAQAPVNPFSQFGGFTGLGGAGLISTARSYAGRNPTGRSRQWCGEFMAMVVRQSGGRVPEGSAKASSWAKLPRTTERVGAVAVMPHHVGIVTGQCEGGGVRIVSGNFGRVKVGEGCVPRSRIVAFVQP